MYSRALTFLELRLAARIDSKGQPLEPLVLSVVVPNGGSLKKVIAFEKPSGYRVRLFQSSEISGYTYPTINYDVYDTDCQECPDSTPR
jgi:hypothetical protein